MTPQRIQLSRKKGWRMPSNTVKVDRSSLWGNPFKIGETKDGILTVNALHAVERFEEWLTGPGDVPLAWRISVWVLRGTNLACWCKPDAPCHADVLLKLANKKP